jgi:hypothetical protein
MGFGKRQDGGRSACRPFQGREAIMRHACFALFAAGTLIMAGTCGAPSAKAMTGGAALAGLQPAIAMADTVVRVSCFRYGWRGWATYHSCEKHPRPRRAAKRR